MADQVITEDNWREKLSPFQYYVLREKGTERAFTGEFWNHHATGLYRCSGCHAALFASDQKFDSGCGWPSFSLPWESDAVNYHKDTTHGMQRIEVTCKSCDGHLGHVFEDGPAPTHLRYCINSASMVFEPRDAVQTAPQEPYR